MPLNSDKLPELVIVDEDDPATARRIRRLAVEGSLRRLHASALFRHCVRVKVG